MLRRLNCGSFVAPECPLPKTAELGSTKLGDPQDLGRSKPFKKSESTHSVVEVVGIPNVGDPQHPPFHSAQRANRLVADTNRSLHRG